MIGVIEKTSFIVMVAIALAAAGVNGEIFVIIDSLDGKAEVQRAGKQQWQDAEKSMKLYNNDMIRILPNGFACLRWPDGSITYARRNSQMLVNLFKGEQPRTRVLSHATVFFGAVFFMIKKIAPRPLFDDSTMRVYTPTAVLSIRGTAFEVSVDKKAGDTHIKVINGAVEVRNILKRVSLYLGSPYRTVVTINNDPSAPQAVVQSDIDSLKKWIPGSAISAAMEKQISQSQKDYYALTGKLEDKCVVLLFDNSSSYRGPWPLAAEITKLFAERLRKGNPRFTFLIKEPPGADPIALARSEGARFALLGTIDVFDISQHAEITPKADEYREYSAADVRLRMKLVDAAGGKLVAEEVFSCRMTNKNIAENSWQKINKLPFDLADKTFAASILGAALRQTLDEATKKLSKIIE